MNPLDFIKFTPKSNCGECNHPTCLAFAVAVTKGGADPAGCPYVDSESLAALSITRTGNGLEQVQRGQDERDMALVAHLKSKICEIDFGRVASRIGAQWNPATPELLTFSYLNQKIELTTDRLLMDGNELVDPRDQILLYNYVAFGGGEIPKSDWIGMESLPNSISKIRTLATYCEAPLAKRFCGRKQILEEICTLLSAVPGPEDQNASLAAVIPVLPFVRQYLLFWDEEPDDGFDSKVKVLFDRKVLDFLDIESLVFSAERMADRIMEMDC